MPPNFHEQRHEPAARRLKQIRTQNLQNLQNNIKQSGVTIYTIYNDMIIKTSILCSLTKITNVDPDGPRKKTPWYKSVVVHILPSAVATTDS